MRIICDYCSHPVSGAVKRTAGNFNLHPACLDQLIHETRPELTTESLYCQNSSISPVLMGKTKPSVARDEMRGTRRLCDS